MTDLTRARAHWLRRDLLAWDLADPALTVRLHAAAAGGLTLDALGEGVPLTRDRAGLPEDVRAFAPQLGGYAAYRLPSDLPVPDLLRGQLVAAAYAGDGARIDATGVQLPWVLDDVYAAATERDYGVTWADGVPTVAVWAPTAQSVALLVAPVGEPEHEVAMTRHDDGAWTARGPASWRGAAYRFSVRVYAPTVGTVVTNLVTDPWSTGLTTDSRRSVMVDLSGPALAPPGWAEERPPPVERPVDRVVYELHVRDFSIGDDTVPAEHRGGYLAFTHPDSAGMTHLRRLAAAGVNTVHLLPTFDIAGIPDRRADQATPAGDLTAYAADSAEPQARVEAVRGRDGYNWGYDPWHYTVPEGSYATDPEGPARTLEHRLMVQALHRAGLQVVLDVVYNHTCAAGQDDRSVLDRIVPGYHHRLSADGEVETSTCCPNTATEHAMTAELVVDSVLTWATAYRVDGFRFDLMGHHPLALMTRLRAALDGLTIERDGVDGRGIYLYGEGWSFGEVAGDALFVQAGQARLAGTGIGSFSDRLRDAVRGGRPFDDDPRTPGLATGLATDADRADGARAAALRHAEDLVKLGLAGNLADFAFRSSAGGTVAGRDVDYHGRPAGYAAEPAETVSYVDAHDNETLYDALALALPPQTSMADRVRMSTLALSTVTLGQGVVFWHAGTDLLRSKSLDRNSYDSGDWFNRIDWTGRQSTFGSGLPPAGDNAGRWPLLRPLLADPALRPDAAAIAAASAGALDLLRMRSSTRLLRLGSAAAIRAKVSFLEAPPGVVAMLVDDTAGAPVDPAYDGVLVVVNARSTAATVDGVGGGWRLHPVQAVGSDAVMRTVSVAGDGVGVPARTTAVLVRRKAPS